MSTGTHRKAAEGTARIPAIPWHYWAVGAVLFALAVILAVSVSMLASPAAQAGTTGYLRPAVTAAGAFPVPGRCKTPTGTLPSGDAARFAGHDYVCTDGTWVPVTGYGHG